MDLRYGGVALCFIGGGGGRGIWEVGGGGGLKVVGCSGGQVCLSQACLSHFGLEKYVRARPDEAMHTFHSADG